MYEFQGNVYLRGFLLSTTNISLGSLPIVPKLAGRGLSQIARTACSKRSRIVVKGWKRREKEEGKCLQTYFRVDRARFTLDLLTKVMGLGGGLLFSPPSLSTTLARATERQNETQTGSNNNNFYYYHRDGWNKSNPSSLLRFISKRPFIWELGRKQEEER